jgi:uncharacterized protein with HEPN domain
MSHSVREYLEHILDETRYLVQETQALDREAFLGSETLKRAFVRSLEVIGEAVKHVPNDIREQHAYIDWRAIAGMRDRLIHGYFGVDYELVWDVICTRIPDLQRQVIAMLAQDSEG